MTPKVSASIVAFGFALMLSWGFPAQGASDFAFGEAPSFSSDETIFSYAASPDKKAFTITFSGLQLGQNGGELPTPVVTRVFSIVLPVSGGEKGVEIPFHFQGSSLVEEGASGYAVFSVNGQTSTVNFGPGPDKSFLQTLVFKAAAASDLRVTILLGLERDAKHPGASASLMVSSVDSETNPVALKAAPKKTGYQ